MHKPFSSSYVDSTIPPKSRKEKS